MYQEATSDCRVLVFSLKLSLKDTWKWWEEWPTKCTFLLHRMFPAALWYFCLCTRLCNVSACWWGQCESELLTDLVVAGKAHADLQSSGQNVWTLSVLEQLSAAMVKNLERWKGILNDQQPLCFELLHFCLVGITLVLHFCECNKLKRFEQTRARVAVTSFVVWSGTEWVQASSFGLTLYWRVTPAGKCAASAGLSPVLLGCTGMDSVIWREIPWELF